MGRTFLDQTNPCEIAEVSHLGVFIVPDRIADEPVIFDAALVVKVGIAVQEIPNGFCLSSS